MKRDRKDFAIVVAVVGLIMMIPSEAPARPKKIVLNGCTMDQVQSVFGQSCNRQAEQDLLNGRGYTHVQMCNGDEMQCCTRDNKTQAILNCRKPARPAGSLPTTQGGLPQFGSVLSRGVEGEELGEGEETPPPAWMTESWLKEHEGERAAE